MKFRVVQESDKMQEPIALLNHTPLLHFYPGGIQQELVVSSYTAKIEEICEG